MPQLKFKKSEVAKLIELSLAAKDYSPSYGDLYNPKYRLDGKEPEVGVFPKAEELDTKRIGPGLTLVGDHGVYLISNSKDQAKTENNGRSFYVSYAKGLDPEKDEETWYDEKRHVWGSGDDFTESFDSDLVEMLRKEIAERPNGYFVIDVLKTSYRMRFTTR